MFDCNSPVSEENALKWWVLVGTKAEQFIPWDDLLAKR